MRLGTPAAWLLRKEGLNMEHITKCKCYIHSLKDGDGKPQLAEAAILEKTGDNAYTAEYNGIRCTAIFNPFVGHFYVDDIYGVLPEEKPAEAGPDSQTNLDHCARRPFEVTITEILKLTVNVEAGSRQEAEDKVFDDWRAHKHVLTADNFDEVKFKAARSAGRKARHGQKAATG
jgi:hypothetical protein